MSHDGTCNGPPSAFTVCMRVSAGEAKERRLVAAPAFRTAADRGREALFCALDRVAGALVLDDGGRAFTAEEAQARAGVVVATRSDRGRARASGARRRVRARRLSRAGPPPASPPLMSNSPWPRRSGRSPPGPAIEDSPSGVAAALAAGMTCLALARDHVGPAKLEGATAVVFLLEGPNPELLGRPERATLGPSGHLGSLGDAARTGVPQPRARPRRNHSGSAAQAAVLKRSAQAPHRNTRAGPSLRTLRSTMRPWLIGATVAHRAQRACMSSEYSPSMRRDLAR